MLLREKRVKENNYVGSVDKIENNILYGWVYDEKNPFDTISVDIYVNDTKIGTTVASLYRKDLEDAKIADGKHGFEFKINKEFLNKDGKNTIKVYTKNKTKKFIGELSYHKFFSFSKDQIDLFGNVISNNLTKYQKEHNYNENNYTMHKSPIKTMQQNFLFDFF